MKIAIISGAHAGEQKQYRNTQTEIVGRAADATWRLNRDPHFSRNHFRLEVVPPECRLIDLQSSNGTCVNGVRVQDVQLKHGDRIECGDTVFKFETSAIRLEDSGPTLLRENPSAD